MVTQQQTQRNQRRRRADFDKGPEEERKRRISSR